MIRSTPPSPAADFSGLGESISPSQKEKGAKLESLKELSYDDKNLDEDLFSFYTESNVTGFPKEPITQALLVTQIVQDSSNLDKRYANIRVAKDLLQMYGDQLVPLMEECWAQKSFTAIRKLVILQSSPTIDHIELQRKKNSLPSLTEKDVLSAWGSIYRGQSHRFLYSNINAMPRGRAYTTTVAIVQSSGTGKSRMVDEQAALVFTIPFCLKQSEEDEQFAHLPVDTIVWEHLRTFSCHDHENSLLVFFASLFSEVRKELDEHIEPQKSYTTLSQVWRSHLQGRRQQLYTSVITAANINSISEYNAVLTAATLELSLLLKTIDNLSSDPCDNSKVKLMLYFDEAHTLTNFKTGSDELNLYYELQTCLNCFLNFPMFTIFLSSDPLIANLACNIRRIPDSPSSRTRDAFGDLQLPIMKLPFDCSPNFPIKQNTFKRQDVCTIEFMSQFGRPLFWSMLEGSEGDKKRLAGTLLDFARSKLLYKDRIEDTFPSYGQVQLIALLDCRLMLAYKPHCEVAFEIELELVTKHMRLAYAFPKSRETFRSGYSSEPLLAEAAAQQFARFRRCSKSSVQDPEFSILLFNCNVFSLVDPGQRWELIARHLLLLAYDKATELEYRREFPHDVNCHDLLYSRGCSVSTFIHELYRGNLAEVVMGTTPDNVESSLTFEEAFRNARVQFTHFAKLADESVATSEAMFAAFARGVAFLCTSQRQVFDFVLPVLLRDETLSESVMTCIFVTVKRRGRPRSAFKINAEKINFFPKYEPDSPEQEFDPGRRPYISMTMDLGVQDGNSPRSGFYTVTQVDRESTFTKRSRKTVRLEGIHDVTTENRQETSLTQRRRIMDSHPRFSIYSYGCSSAEYKVIEDRRNENYASLLQSNRHALDVQQKELAEAIRRLKPFWSKKDVFNY